MESTADERLDWAGPRAAKSEIAFVERRMKGGSEGAARLAYEERLRLGVGRRLKLPNESRKLLSRKCCRVAEAAGSQKLLSHRSGSDARECNLHTSSVALLVPGTAGGEARRFDSNRWNPSGVRRTT